ncbi:serine/threonine-protein kinase [Gemmatimonadota bacterium Y43]|uniref:serine/threonine-protein kinase n=1 Tax=Gaopeijia maritima TaxID=3119007 RepID=UPI00327B0CFC
MTPGDETAGWARIDALFQAALEVAPRHWDDVLESAEASDAERREVLRLLEADRAAEGFLARPMDTVCREDWAAAMAHVGVSPARELDRTGQLLGAYRLTERLGRGGMASVYRGERVDGAFQQAVAVKIIRRGVDTDDVVARFLAERQILSSLNHPNIARVVDGGATDDGQPYLVMELVEGRPLARYADEERLSTKERLALLLQVTDAVAHAHRALVVHRDLKPSNILVTSERQVRLLDFGIAKLLDPGAWPGPSHATRTGMRLLTPEYASPEQLRGEPVTTASDVYQLGALMHRLLTGAALGHAAPGALSDDLRRVVMKAVADEPERRYASAQSLGDDLRRYLSGHPVQARVPSPAYRLRKFLGRHRWVAPVGAAAMLAGGVYVVTLNRHTAALERERNVARTEASTAEAVTDFLAGLFAGADPYAGGSAELPVRTLLDQGAARVLEEVWPRPDIRVRLIAAVTRAYVDLHLYEDAVSFARAALGVGADESWHLPLPAGTVQASEPMLREIESLVGYAGVQLAATSEGRMLLEGLVAQRRARGDTLGAAWVRDLAAISQGHFQEGNAEAGARVTNQWLPHAEVLDGAPTPLTLMALDRLFHLSFEELDVDASEGLALRQLQQARALHPDTTPAVAHAYEDLASVRVRAGRWADAAEPARAAADLTAAMFGRDNATTSYAVETLASVFLELGRVDEALALQREVTEVRIRALGEDHMIIPMTRYQLGRALRAAGDLGAARDTLGWALDRTLAMFGPTSRMTAVMLEELGRVRLALGELAGAEALLTQAGEIYDKAYEATDLRRVAWTLTVAQLRVVQGRSSEARALLEAQAASLLDAGMGDHPLSIQVDAALAPLPRR